MDELFIGSRCTKQDVFQPVEQSMILSATESYFRYGKLKPVNEVNRIDIEEEQPIRLKTGGPIFVREEEALVRSSCILCAAEVFARGKVSILSNHVCSAMSLCIDALHLDNYRPVSLVQTLFSFCRYQFVLVKNLKSFD